MKKLLALTAITALFLTMVGCGSSKNEEPAVSGSDISSTIHTPAAPAVSEVPEKPEDADKGDASGETQTPAVQVDWAQVDAGIGVLAVRLPIVADSYYSWKWEISDEKIVDPLNSSTESGKYTISFRGIGTGECTIQFRYCCADAVAETRTIRVKAEDEKIMQILSAEHTVVEGVRDDVLQPEIMEMLADNRVDRILAGNSTMSVVSAHWQVENGEEVPVSHCVEQYRTEDGALVYQSEMEYYDLGWLYTGYQSGSLIPNVYCTYDTIKNEPVVLLIDAAAGDQLVRDLWLGHSTQSRPVIAAIEEDLQYNTRIMTTVSENQITGRRDEHVYFIDLDTGLLSSLTHTVFDLATGAALQVTRSNVVYGEYRILEPQAYANVIDTADSCKVSFVVDPGKSGEYTHTISIKKHAETGWYGAQEYTLYADAACTQKIDVIDTGRDEVTVYVAKARA